jgi:hypothetical protein
MRRYLALATAAGITLLLQSSLRGQDKPAVKADITKNVRVEKPASDLLARESAAVTNTAKSFANPKVQPGGVHWHPTWTAACDAAGKSGKPVLLFQMMGKLDDQFC